MSETSVSHETHSHSGMINSAVKDFALRYPTAVSASIASLASTTVGYLSFNCLGLM